MLAKEKKITKLDLAIYFILERDKGFMTIRELSTFIATRSRVNDSINRLLNYNLIESTNDWPKKYYINIQNG